jgi:hypothetical protein
MMLYDVQVSIDDTTRRVEIMKEEIKESGTVSERAIKETTTVKSVGNMAPSTRQLDFLLLILTGVVVDRHLPQVLEGARK